ncbi:MAG: hypothetical protein R3288_04060 [Woeseiaceae bacterium]|nr:hypothetical protein [Woeseiaceae bacterium]
MQDLEHRTNPLMMFTRTLGILLLAAATVVICIVLVTMYQIVFTPEAVPIADAVARFLSENPPAAIAEFQGRATEITVDRGLKALFSVFVGAMAVMALGSLFHALIGGGLRLLKFGNERR